MQSCYKYSQRNIGIPYKIDKSIIQNSMGAKFNQIKVYWSRGNRTIQLHKYYDKITEGIAMFLPKENLSKLKAKTEKETQKAVDIL